MDEARPGGDGSNGGTKTVAATSTFLALFASRTYRHVFAAKVVAWPGTGLATVAPCPAAIAMFTRSSRWGPCPLARGAAPNVTRP